jgi:hypothetical protein
MSQESQDSQPIDLDDLRAYAVACGLRIDPSGDVEPYVIERYLLARTLRPIVTTPPKAGGVR